MAYDLHFLLGALGARSTERVRVLQGGPCTVLCTCWGAALPGALGFTAAVRWEHGAACGQRGREAERRRRRGRAPGARPPVEAGHGEAQRLRGDRRAAGHGHGRHELLLADERRGRQLRGPAP